VSAARPLRVLLVGSDGFSAGHIARTVAIARALGRHPTEVRAVIATTSTAHALLDGPAAGSAVVVRLPAPAIARAAGFADADRRRLVRAALEGVVAGLAPDLIVLDTFPAGPHGELAGVGRDIKRALVRRSVINEDDAALREGLDDIGLVVACADPLVPGPAPRAVSVPPITVFEHAEALDRARARAELGLPASGRAILVAAGGGGDGDAAARADRIAAVIARLEPATAIWRAPGVVAGPGPLLQPRLAAFDAAFAPAGYNTAHELAKARVPAALFAQPRSFDDQAARAARFAAAGFACALDEPDDADAVAGALAWLRGAVPPALEAGGADRAAAALLAFAGAA
jgi:predicted glycosyltransferase